MTAMKTKILMTVFCLAVYASRSIGAVGGGSGGASLSYYPLDERQEFSLSLNGTWKFRLGGDPGDFAKSDFNDGAWAPIQVPGNLELQGFEEPRYGKKGVGTADGFYRRAFTAPSTWKGRRIVLRFEGVGFGFEFWIDGKRVGEFASSFNRSEFDVTDFVEPGRPALLAVRVLRRPKGWEFDTNDDWSLSGIHRDVDLFSLPAVRIKDYTVNTSAGGDGKQASVRVSGVLENASGLALGAALAVTVIGPDGAMAGTLTQPVEWSGSPTSTVQMEIPIVTPRLWTAETPSLYRLGLALVVDGKPVHQVTQRLGLRTTTIEKGVFKLNGRPVKFRGVNHHDIHPATGRSMTRAQYIEDLELMKAANINAIRMSHYPPVKVFLDLCDEYGFYVIDEVPFGFGEEHLTDESYSDVLALRARATVARDKNQTCVLVWTVGNENPYTPMVVRTAGVVKEADPSRSRCIAHPTGKYYFPLPSEVDIVAPHYLMPRGFAANAGRGEDGGGKGEKDLQKGRFLDDVLTMPEVEAPVLMTEYCHAAGTSLEGLQESWEIMRNSDRFIGGCIWLFQDQGLYREVPAGSYPGLPKGTDQAPVEIGKVEANTWVADKRVIDTGGAGGADGIVDADRFPQSDYYAVRKVYSPVVIPIPSLPVKSGRQTFTIPIENRYDFTDLSAVAGRWALHVDGRVEQSGSLSLKAPPRGKTSVSLVVDLPDNPAGHDLFLRFVFTDATRRDIAEHTLRLMSGTQPSAPYRARLETPNADRMVRTENGPVTLFTAAGQSLEINRDTGAVRFGAKARPGQAFDGLALRVGRPPQMSELRAYRSGAKSDFWEPYLLTNAIASAVKIGGIADGRVKVDLSLRFNRAGASLVKKSDVGKQAILADVHLTFSSQGWLDVDYTLTPVNATDYLLELGLAFRLPADSTRLTWLGDGPYAVYPAQPRSMDRGVYSVAPKAAFNPANRMVPGGRAAVDLAVATDEAGNGLGIACEDATVSLEPAGDTAFFSHLLRVAGHGGKRAISRVTIKADKIQQASGSLRLVPLAAGKWPAVFKTVLAEPENMPKRVEPTMSVSPKGQPATR